MILFSLYCLVGKNDMDKFNIGIELLYQLPIKAKQHLNIDTSLIPYSILITVIRHSIRNENLSVKSLFSQLPYSVMGVRHHFNRLIDSGWVELKESESDKRIKIIVPSEKLHSRINLLIDDLSLVANYENLRR